MSTRSVAAWLLPLVLLAPRFAAGEEEAPSPPRRPDLSTPYGDERTGAEEARKVASAIGLVDAPALQAYVSEVGARLARNAPGYRFDYSFAIVDAPDPNAFALPGGFVYISRGALALTNSEDELANVLGHEIAHVASRHAAAASQVAGSGLLRAFEMPALAAYGRDLERSADRMGQGLAAVTGYDPAGMRDFLVALDGLERVRFGTSRIPGFLATHPGSRARAAEAGQRASMTAWRRSPGVSASRADHLRRLEGLVVGDSAAQGLFDGPRFLHPVLGFTMRFPDGWETRNTPAAVGAVAPRRDAQVVLEMADKGMDLEEAAHAWIEKGGKPLRLEKREHIRLVGRPALRLGGSVPGGSFTATFLAFRGQVYRIVALARSRSSYDDLLVQVPRSFRPMTRELLERVKEARIHLVEARAGETLAELSRRTDDRWDIQRTAVLNGLQPTATLEAGELVKVVAEVPWRPPGG